MIDQNQSPPLPSKYITCEYGIRHPEYGFYQGTARDSFEENFSHDKWLAFGFTENGANTKKAKFPLMFGKCSIEKI